MNRKFELIEQVKNGSLGELIGQYYPEKDPSWMNLINDSTQDWLQDHVVQDVVIFPGAGYCELSLEISKKYFQK